MIRSTLEVLFSGLVAYVLLGLAGGTVYLLSHGGETIISPLSWYVAVAAVLLGAATILGRTFFLGEPRFQLSPWMFVLGLLAYLLSDIVARRYTFFLGTEVRWSVVVFGVAILGALWKFRRRQTAFHAFLVLFFIQCFLTIAFLRYADGRIIFVDDHPSFLYRLQLLRSHFPSIPFYNVDWNAGYSAREFFPSGVLNVFFLTAPLIYLVPDIDSFQGAGFYNWLFPYLYIFLIPWSIYFASRLAQLTRTAALCAAVLSLGPSMAYFEWLLKYGTIAFAVSAGIFPLVVVLSVRLALWEEAPKYWHLFALLLVSFCCLSWTLSAVALLPLVLIALWYARTTFAADRRFKVILFACLFLVVNGPWLMTFVQESKVLNFLSQDKLPGSHSTGFHYGHSHGEESAVIAEPGDGEGFRAAWSEGKLLLKKFRQGFIKINPVLLFLFLPGLAFFPQRRLAQVFAAVTVWLFALAFIGDGFKPQLELRRMLILLSFMMTLLAGHTIAGLLHSVRTLELSWTWRTGWRSAGAVAGAVLLFGCLVMTPITVGAAYQNRSDERFSLANKEVKHFVEALNNLSKEGRVFFTGFILHELGAETYRSQDGGHVAPLPRFTGREFYASHYYHARWSNVDPIPQSFRKRGAEGMEEFLDLVNARYVVTFRREWRDYCFEQPGYRQITKIGRFRIFERPEPNGGYFLEGAGKVERIKGGLKVIPGSKNMVLKYRHLPKLRLQGPTGVKLQAVKVFDEDLGGSKSEEVFFIGLEVPQHAVEQRTPIFITY